MSELVGDWKVELFESGQVMSEVEVDRMGVELGFLFLLNAMPAPIPIATAAIATNAPPIMMRKKTFLLIPQIVSRFVRSVLFVFERL